MNMEHISTLAEIVAKNGLSALEVCEGELKIRLERQAMQAMQVQAVLPMQETTVHQAAAAPVPAVQTEERPSDFNRLKEVTAPMVGVFYAAASPDAKPFVQRGDRVKKGDVLCIIEAMKLLNEIVAETDGEIADICVANGQVVEFSQVLFKLF